MLGGAFFRRENGQLSRARLKRGGGGIYGANFKQALMPVPTLHWWDPENKHLLTFWTLHTSLTSPWWPQLSQAQVTSFFFPCPFYLFCSLKIRFPGDPVADLVGNSDINHLKTLYGWTGRVFCQMKAYCLNWKIWNFTYVHSPPKTLEKSGLIFINFCVLQNHFRQALIPRWLYKSPSWSQMMGRVQVVTSLWCS